MGSGSSADSAPAIFSHILTSDLAIGDSVCNEILEKRLLTRQIVEAGGIAEIVSQKPNNMKILVHSMVFSIEKLSQIPHQAELPQMLTTATFNSFLLLQHIHKFCTDTWFLWETPMDGARRIPSLFFVSSFRLLNHPQILHCTARNSILYELKYEMTSTLLLFLLDRSQGSVERYPNQHYECLDEADPFSLFRFLLSYQTVDELFRISVILTANGIAFCPNWQTAFASLNFSSIGPLMNTILRFPTEQQLSLMDSQSPGVYHEIVALLYQTLLRHDEALELLKNGHELVTALCLPLQLLSEQRKLCYFQSLVLSTLVLLTSDSRIGQSLNAPFTGDFPCKQSIHSGSHADLLLEVVMNTAGTDLRRTVSLLPAIACIFQNVASHARSFSHVTCNRLFRFMQQVTELDHRIAPQVGSILVDGFNQILLEQFPINLNALIYVIRNMSVFSVLKKMGVDIQNIASFRRAFKAKAREAAHAKIGTDEAEMILKQMKTCVFIADDNFTFTRSHVFSGEIADLWPDWMRTLAMRSGSMKVLRHI